MKENWQIKKPIFPVISVLSCVLILIIGLITAKKDTGLYFLGGVWLLLICFGYYKNCVRILPFAAMVACFFCGLTYLISRDTGATLAALCRGLALCVAIIPGMAMSPAMLCRNLSQMHVPRSVTLGMMIAIGFFPLLAAEVRRVHEAMKTRGVSGMWLRPTVFYRAFMIPLVVRLVNISDTLALSVETRGFEIGSNHYSVYKTVAVHLKDIFYAVLIIGLSVAAVIL